MSATKKQVNDLENAVVVLEERVEKMEEEHQLLKQMISMQSTLIDNLQMMVKMMSVQPAYKVMHVGGESKNANVDGDVKVEDIKENSDVLQESQGVKQQSHSIKTLKTRMSRVM
jgi:hypothetical protein